MSPWLGRVVGKQPWPASSPPTGAQIVRQKDKHLILLTATPHSGIERSFRSLLSLVREFAEWDTASLAEPQRIELAKHFVQRTRRDIEQDWEGDHCFPKREPATRLTALREYRELFRKPMGSVRRS